LARLAAAGVPSFHTPEACADAVAAALRRKPPRAIEVRNSPDPLPIPPPFREREEQAANTSRSDSALEVATGSFLPLKGGGIRRGSGAGRIFDELEAYALLDRLGVPRAASIAIDAGSTNAPALPFAYPVAVKALSAEIAHKSDVGGVALNVRDEPALLVAIRQIQKSTNAGRVLVQPMIAGLGEVLIGYRVDADVGPLVMLAAGGILAEIHRDRSLRLAPIDLAEARAMIGEVAALKVLAGYRGRPHGDLDALAQALVALSRLAVADGPGVAEAEVNPLIVLPKGHGVIAVDALVRLA
jgi:acyl-CoA synthetase (NDP forming)